MFVENTVSIQLSNLSKKFNSEWIFKSLSLQISPGSKLAVLGNNGSGKSTLLQIVSGYLIPDKGEVLYSQNNVPVKIEDVNDLISFASPYLQLTEEFTLAELLQHIKLFKPFISNLEVKDLITLLELNSAANKPIKHFSSGMKQRTKLGIAILAEAPILFLDEPLSNLDAQSINWYGKMIKEYAMEKTIVVCSNAIKEEYVFCDSELNIASYK